MCQSVVMDIYYLVKTIHIISSTLLFGTGLGIAFFMGVSCFSKNRHEKLYAIRTGVLADFVFTLPAVILQPVSGAVLIWKGGHDPFAPWLLWSYGLYALAGLCWLPVVYIQIRLKRIIQACATADTAVPLEYHRLFKIWFVLGWPAFRRSAGSKVINLQPDRAEWVRPVYSLYRPDQP